MKILMAAMLLAFIACSSSNVPPDVRTLKGKPIGGANLETKYCKFEETGSSNALYLYMYFPCKDFTIAVNKRTQIVEGVFAGKK